MLCVSVFEHKAWILPARGIDEKLPQDTWYKIVGRMVSGIIAKRQAEAICQAVDTIGSILSRHFPIKPDDTDEFKNLIID